MSDPDSEPRILRSDDGAGRATLTLNRPGKLNALDTRTFEELDAHLADLERQADTIGCVVLRGIGRGFCAGADLGAMGLHADGSPVDRAFKPGVIVRLSRLPQPVVVAVHGVCFTGGLELALAGDFIVAKEGSRFADTHGKWGLIGAWGIMQRLSRRIGAAAARRMSMTGCTVEAGEALAIGLADRIAAAGRLDETVAELVQAILANSWHTNAAIKRTQRETEGMTLADALAWEVANHPGTSPDHAERLAKFGRK